MKFDGKKIIRCYAISFDYDASSYTMNEKDEQKLPNGIKSITIETERET